MANFEIALAGWLLFFTNLDVGIEPQLLPPATQADISELGEEIGFDLPQDFVSLYLTADGQVNPYSEDRPNVEMFSPLFGWYEFIPLKQVLNNYNFLVELQQSSLPSIYEADVRTGDPVAAVDWQPGWVPFAVSNAAYYAVDLTPLRGGSYGQVIEFGHDTVENRVLAPSISEFLILATTNLDPYEPHRYEVNKVDPDSQDSTDFSSLYFNMDWTQIPEPPIDPSDYVPDPELVQWDDASHSAVDAFTLWLEGRGFDQVDRETFKNWAFELHMPMLSRSVGLLGPPAPDKVDQRADLKLEVLYELVSISMALSAPTSYTVDELPVSLEEAFSLLSEYRVEIGALNQEQFAAAQSVIERDRPARRSIMDEQSYSSSKAVEEREDGSLLLCDLELDNGELQYNNCEVFSY